MEDVGFQKLGLNVFPLFLVEDLWCISYRIRCYIRPFKVWDVRYFAIVSILVHNESSTLSRIGDRSSSDVVVRIRTQEGRDDWIYCHSDILVKKSKYFADRLSDNWPTCQILDSRNCVEVYCEECDFDHHITVLRLLYATSDVTVTELSSVKNALGTLRVAVELGCPQIVSTCVGYLEAVPWEESEEEEILKTIPGMGSQAEPILARLQPVNALAVVRIFLAAIRFATSSPPSSMNDLKTSAQEQLEYMLTEDDDAPLLTADDEIKLEARQCVNRLLARFVNLVDSLLGDLHDSVAEAEKIELFQSHLTDLSWASQIVTKLETSSDFVYTWVETSVNIVKVAERVCPESSLTGTKLKVLEVTAKVLEAIGYGTVILPTTKRLHMVKVWLPFVRFVKSAVDSVGSDEENDLMLKADGELWQTLESAFVSIILTFPSPDQAEILTEWLENKHIRYPDLTEAFEVWCYRSKVAKRRLALLDGNNPTANSI
ncbi:BTB/POZ domain-containing protein [Sesamum angolense]|uniref:BTB/POZ domain-containing protein n=1 Tax=Sesamum angolense TaxID=2727404 RepID=A0AAE1T5Q3_9LAMI|nr:BTB/POZ domain-containing protein [Sesamum angolense]